MNDKNNDERVARCKARLARLTPEELIERMMSAGCCSEFDRRRLVSSMTKVGLIAELCGCECSGVFPFAASQDMQGSEPEALAPACRPKASA